MQAGHGGLDRRTVVLALSGKGFQQQQPEGVDVDGRPDGLAGDLFRGEVGRGADHQSGRRDARGIDEAGNAEVGELDAAASSEQNVGGLDVAVHEPL